MKAANFVYRKPASVAEALTMLDAEGPEAKLLAGGQSLGPMLNLRIVQPHCLIDVSALTELRRDSVEGDEWVLGAGLTHADIEDGRAGSGFGGWLARIAGGIAYRAVRNRGTIGGSLCHADPAADWVVTLPALGAVAVLRSLKSERRLPIERFITGPLTNALTPSEMLVAVRIPKPGLNAKFGYAKHCRKVGEFSKASAALLVDPLALTGRIVLGALERAPLVANARELLAAGSPLRIDADAALTAAGVDDPVRRNLHAKILARALSATAA